MTFYSAFNMLLASGVIIGLYCCHSIVNTKMYIYVYYPAAMFRLSSSHVVSASFWTGQTPCLANLHCGAYPNQLSVNVNNSRP